MIIAEVSLRPWSSERDMATRPRVTITDASKNGNLGLSMKRYPANEGIGRETKDENVIITESILALAFGSIISISFVKKVLDIEKAET